MRLVEFTGERGKLYINPENIIHIEHSLSDQSQTEITFVSGLIYIVQQDINTVRFELQDLPD